MPPDVSPPAITRVLSRLQESHIGHTATLRHLLAAYLVGGHVLLEDYPGTGKTTLAKALAHAVGVSFNRVQCTPDLLPADILGVSIFNPRHQSFELHKGPVFTEVLLADEINRASPRTQSALLEAMAERQVTLDGATHALPPGFCVIATQNPVEFQGTYPLPEAQLDRFAICLSLGYLPVALEVAMVRTAHARDTYAGAACVTPAELAELRRLIAQMPCTEPVIEYAVELVAASRGHPAVRLGASPRASIMLVDCARALACFDGVGFVTPDHIQELAVPVLAHRLLLSQQSRFEGIDAPSVVRELLAATPLPR
ncbi:MAG: AAA family ATPase [Gammaproteobacteria bacterium]